MKILIAEDDPITLETLAACLLPEGYAVSLASDGEAALRQWKAEKPDVVCLDIMMPKMDGYEVCRRIRAEDNLVPILFLSAKNEEIDVVVGLELGADDFIRKPFGKSELTARIRAMLRRAASRREKSGSSTFTLGSIRIHTAELRATLANGTSVDLTPRETSILQVLSEHRGKPVSRDTLLDRCWGLNYFPESRTLDQHMANLRKKLGIEAEEAGGIHTVRGVGYKVDG